MSLVELKPLLEPYDAIFDIRYATTNNVTGDVLYSNVEPQLDAVAAEALAYTAKHFASFTLRMVVWDALRTREAHQRLRAVNPDERYVLEDSNHLKGLAVDVTLADAEGRYLDMGTDYDDFSDLAHAYTTGLADQQVSNRLLLASGMARAGFTRWPYEWWHFDYTGVPQAHN